MKRSATGQGTPARLHGNFLMERDRRKEGTERKGTTAHDLVLRKRKRRRKRKKETKQKTNKC